MVRQALRRLAEQFQRRKQVKEETATILASVSNDGQSAIESGLPYLVNVSVEGTAALLFHRWSVDGVEAKSKASKGSKAKKSDDIESYVYRDRDGMLCIPAEYFRMSIINASKYRQDPRSPRKSAMDLFKAGLVSLNDLCSLGVKDWDYVDRRRVMIQRNGITRHRPAMYSGWKASFQLQVLIPEYIGPQTLNETLQMAGRLIGIADFRPTFGRFCITRFSVEQV
jgi:hypothetical protein